MKILISIFILISLEMFPSSGQQKTLSLQKISSQQGLSDNQVTAVIKDKFGFIWIGTKDGLNRYDGREFHVFRHDERDTLSLCGNKISCLETDGDSILWIGTTNSGFCSYDFRTGKFRAFNMFNCPGITNNINDIAYDKNSNRLFIGFSNAYTRSIALPVNKNLQMEVYMDDKKRATHDLHFSGSHLYTATLGKFIRKIENGKIHPHKSMTGINGAQNKIINDQSGNLWVGSWDNALHHFDKECNLVRSYIFNKSDKLTYSGDEIISLAIDQNNLLWCGTKYSGIHFFDLDKKAFTNKVALASPIKSRINCLYTDSEKRIWIGTDIGLYLYDPLLNQFNKIKLPVTGDNDNCNVTGRIITTNGNEYVSTMCGLFYKTISENEYRFKSFKFNNEPLQLTSIFESSDGTVYIGSNKTIHILDTVKMQLHEFKLTKGSAHYPFQNIVSSRFNSISEIIINNDPVIIALAYGHGYYFINKRLNRILWLNPPINSSGVNTDHLVRKVFVDSKNNIWLCGAQMGLMKLNLDTSVFSDYSSFNDSISPLMNVSVTMVSFSDSANRYNDVFDISENGDNSYCFTTQGAGLVDLNFDGKRYRFNAVNSEYKSMQGLLNAGKNDRWMITSTGIIRFNGNQKISYDYNHGIPDGLNGYFFRMPDGVVSAGFNGGIIEFKPELIEMNKEQPRLVVSGIWVMDQQRDSLLHGSIKLKHNENFLKFYVSLNTFTNNNQATIYYKLDGVDDTWRSNQNNPLITYTNLPHGNFTLKVKAVNSDGIESDVFELPVVITPPFYKTIYFYMPIAILIAGIVYTVYRYRIRQILKLQEVRNKIARDLHDDIGSTIGSIHLYSQIANSKLNGNNKDDIKSILQKIENSSSEIIDKTSDVVWVAKATNDTLKNLIHRMEGYSASLLGAAGIQFNIDYDERITDMKLEMTERKNIFLINKEAIHNIIKYAKCTEVKITIKKHGDKIHITVSDNGTGFTRDELEAYNGNGIKNMKSRAAEIKGSFSITSLPGAGTTIELHV